MKRFKVLIAALSLATVLAFVGIASADVIGPDEQACQGLVAGNACIAPSGGAGTCTAQTVRQGAPGSDVTRIAVMCVANGNVDGSLGAETGPTNSSCGCAVPGHAPLRAGAVLALFGLAMMVSRRRVLR